MFAKLARLLRPSRQELTDLEAWQRDIVARARPLTMAGDARTAATVLACEYIVRHQIPGDIVECGVWRGGQVVAAALTMLHLDDPRAIHLFDTFEGMTEATSVDRDASGRMASDYATRFPDRKGERWCEAGVDDVRRNVQASGYPMERVNFVVGKVEETLPAAAPGQVAFLRLDTDWYASTAHELIHLYPRVSPGGVVVVDDYGHWQGARKATDDYLRDNGVSTLLHRIDYSGRQFLKR